MSESLRRLLQGAFDYAGLYPPASHGMEQALREYLRHRAAPESWLVNRFCCPVEQLDELLLALKAQRQEAEIDEVCRIAVQGATLEAFKHDLWAIERFEKAAEPWAEVECYEARTEHGADASGWLKHLANAGFEDAFVEVSWSDDIGDQLQAIALSGSIGAKAVLNRSDAAPAPESRELAAFLQDCVNLDVPFKLVDVEGTPVRRFDRASASARHGYLNAAIASCLASVHDLSKQEVEKILLEEDAQSFWFSNGGLGWRELEASNDEVDSIRGIFCAVSVCSIEGATSGLREIGLLPDATPA